MEKRGSDCKCSACSSSFLLPLLETKGKLQPRFVSASSGNWFDETKIDLMALQRGQSFFRANFFSLNVAHLVGLLSLIRIESIFNVLNLTGNSKDSQKSFERYFRTIMHIQTWCELNWTQNYKKVQNSYKEVRLKHNLNSELSKESFGLHFSHRDMVLTQWAFVAPVVLQHRKFGIKESADAELKDFLYLWQIIAKFVNIEDQFNLCRGNIEDVHRECTAILHKIVAPRTKIVFETADIMATNLVQGLKNLIPFIEPNSFKYFTSYIICCTAPVQATRWQYTFNVWLLERGFNAPLIGHILRYVFNTLLRAAISYKKFEMTKRRRVKSTIQRVWKSTKENFKFLFFYIMNFKVINY